MNGVKSLSLTLLLLGAIQFACAPEGAAARAGADREFDCSRPNPYRDQPGQFCEVKEQRLPATGEPLVIDGGAHSGIDVKGWDRAETLVRALVHTGAGSDAAARELAQRVRILTSGGRVRLEGPAVGGGRLWTAGLEVFVPRQSALSLRTVNGGINIADVRGRVDFTAQNGGVTMKRLGGRVRGEAVNGALVVELDGSRWEGEGMDVRTTNGAVMLSIPENYSARLETGTREGQMRVDFPLGTTGSAGKTLSVNLGSGGATVRAETVNGAVNVSRR